jgi:hypothetical protein
MVHGELELSFQLLISPEKTEKGPAGEGASFCVESGNIIKIL